MFSGQWSMVSGQCPVVSVQWSMYIVQCLVATGQCPVVSEWLVSQFSVVNVQWSVVSE